MTVGAWITAYLCRVPLFPKPAPGQTTVLLMLIPIFLGGFIAARYSTRGILAALAAGALSGILDILIVGSLLHDVAKSDAIAPAAALWMGGSILLNSVVAGVGGILGILFRASAETRLSISWSPLFAFVLAAATLPLITAGGLVTAYGDGMAVPDWPNSYGYNMFLFPLSRMQAVRGNFYEHAHRLMGTLVGLTAIAFAVHTHLIHRASGRALAIWGVFILAIGTGLAALALANTSSAVPHSAAFTPATLGVFIVGTLVGLAALVAAIRIHLVRRFSPLSLAAWCVFVAVCIQGALGGFRVTLNSIPLATIHGIFAQLVLAAMACLVAANSRYFTPPASSFTTAADRFFSAALVAALTLQLALGALVRQRVDSLVMIHIFIAAVVGLLAFFCGFRAVFAGPPGAHQPQFRPLKRTGIAVLISVGIQLLLGVIALMLRPATPTVTKTTLSALWTTAHQANGALLLALCAVLWIWNWRLSPSRGGLAAEKP
jgi:cytochrome c oxidase assembly protein subunit 15